MNNAFKVRFKKWSKWSVGLFILLFIFRLLYGYIQVDSPGNNNYRENFFDSFDGLRKNYASEKVALKEGNLEAASEAASSQKYEKTASIKTKTSEFEKDEQSLKSKAASYNAVIQYEQSLGQKGNRQIHLIIGVSPSLFDSLYLRLQKIGNIKATEITKVDKTNEYRQLNAKKASIEKSLQSLNELKSKSGQISDFVSLNEKILEIEEKAQELGVELGNFDSENEFCTIRFSMYEGAAEKGTSFLHRIKVALEWAIQYFAIIVFATLMASASIFVLLLIVDKLKVMGTIKNQDDNK